MNEAPTPPKTVRCATLESAIRKVDTDRNLEYGDPNESMRSIAAFWDAYLDARPRGIGESLDGYDVALMLSLMKIARAARRPKTKSMDSLIDQAGYAAIAAEIRQRTAPAPAVTIAPGLPDDR